MKPCTSTTGYMSSHQNTTTDAPDRLVFCDPTDDRVINLHPTLIDALALLGVKSGLACSMYYTFLRLMYDNEWIMISRSILAERLNISKPGVSRATKLLSDLGLIEISKLAGNTVYRVVENPDVKSICDKLGVPNLS